MADVTSPPSSVRWPRAGMMRGGKCWERAPSELPTGGSGSGYWATPGVGIFRSGMPTRALRDATYKQDLQDQVALVQTWPTPDAREGPETFLARQAVLKAKHRNGNGMGTPLAMAVQLEGWPTPRATDGSKGGPGQVNGRGQVDSLPGAVQWPTPGAADWKSGTGWDHAESSSAGHTPQLRHIMGGLLNPAWVESLMGWPTGWTGLPPEARGRLDVERRSMRGRRRAR